MMVVKRMWALGQLCLIKLYIFSIYRTVQNFIPSRIKFPVSANYKF